MAEHAWYVARVWNLTEEQAATVAKDAARWVTDLPALDPDANSEGFLFSCGHCGLEYKHAAGEKCRPRRSRVSRFEQPLRPVKASHERGR